MQTQPSFLDREIITGVLPPAAKPSAAVLSRRQFLVGTGAALAMGSLPREAAPATMPLVDQDFWRRPRELWIKRQESGEEVRAQFWANGSYLSQGYTQLCWLLRDVRERSAVQMDQVLLNVMTGLQAYYAAYGVKGPLIVTSGFRTFKTNERLAGEGAARNSMHLYGRAVDLTIPGVSVDHLGQVKQYLHAGGLGFYPGKHFIHIDTGNVRTWRG